MIAPVERPPAPSIEIVTLAPGEAVRIRLIEPAADGVYELCGSVVAVDAVGVRLLPSSYRTDSLPFVKRAAGDAERVLPWQRIAYVSLTNTGARP